MPRAQRYALPAAAAAVYVLAASAAAAVGFRFWIPWAVYQLLDQVELRRAPLEALLALHAQPPGLNALLAAGVQLAALLGATPEAVLAPLFYLLQALVVVLVALLARRLTGSAWLGLAAAVLAAADPALHVYGTAFFYELPLAVLVLAALAAGLRFLETGRERYLLGFVLAVAGMCLLRSLYHPLWAAGMLGLLAAGRARLAPGGARRGLWLRSGALLVLLLAAWPLKNALLFGAPVMTSWRGYNLSRGTPVRQPALWAYIENGAVPPALQREWRRRAPARLRDAPVLVAPAKSTLNRNWNHYLFLLTDRELARAALAWRREHPREWLRQGLANYLLWGRASYLDSYWGVPRGPKHPLYQAYARWHQRLLFPDLRPLVERLTPGAPVHALTVVWGGPAPYTLFALAGLPLLLAATALLLSRRLGARPSGRGTESAPSVNLSTARKLSRLGAGPEAWVALLAVFTLVWVLAVPCLTDGTEGNRMRYSVSPCVLLLAAWVAAVALRRPPNAVILSEAKDLGGGASRPPIPPPDPSLRSG